MTIKVSGGGDPVAASAVILRPSLSLECSFSKAGFPRLGASSFNDHSSKKVVEHAPRDTRAARACKEVWFDGKQASN